MRFFKLLFFFFLQISTSNNMVFANPAGFFVRVEMGLNQFNPGKIKVDQKEEYQVIVKKCLQAIWPTREQLFALNPDWATIDKSFSRCAFVIGFIFGTPDKLNDAVRLYNLLIQEPYAEHAKILISFVAAYLEAVDYKNAAQLVGYEFEIGELLPETQQCYYDGVSDSKKVLQEMQPLAVVRVDFARILQVHLCPIAFLVGNRVRDDLELGRMGFGSSLDALHAVRAQRIAATYFPEHFSCPAGAPAPRRSASAASAASAASCARVPDGGAVAGEDSHFNSFMARVVAAVSAAPLEKEHDLAGANTAAVAAGDALLAEIAAEAAARERADAYKSARLSAKKKAATARKKADAQKKAADEQEMIAKKQAEDKASAEKKAQAAAKKQAIDAQKAIDKKRAEDAARKQAHVGPKASYRPKVALPAISENDEDSEDSGNDEIKSGFKEFSCGAESLLYVPGFPYLPVGMRNALAKQCEESVLQADPHAQGKKKGYELYYDQVLSDPQKLDFLDDQRCRLGQLQIQAAGIARMGERIEKPLVDAISYGSGILLGYDDARIRSVFLAN